MKAHLFLPVIALLFATGSLHHAQETEGNDPGGTPSLDSSWVNLLAGDRLDAWRGLSSPEIPSGWTLEDGILHFKKIVSANASLITRNSYDNFELRFDWKISKAGNSGVKYRSQGSLGLEFQIIDDGMHADSAKPTRRTGSLYDLAAAPEGKPLHPAGQWNTGRIVFHDSKIEHWLNGQQIVVLTFQSPEWNERFAKSKYCKHSSFASQAGPLLLQDHNNEVSFRNIFVKEL